MPISAPPPSWASIKNKPNTVSGFGITDMGSQTVANANAVPWSGVSGKPTTVSGLGLSDFNASAISAQAGASFGAVGTYVGVFAISGGTDIALGATVAGSALTGVNSAGNQASLGLSGTWRNMGQRADGEAPSGIYLRIS